jgi:hypothetical protein
MAPLSRFPPPVTSRHRGRRAIITGGSFGGARHRMPIGIQICSGTEWSPAERVSGCSRRPQRRQPPRAHAEIARLKFHLARYRRAEFGRSSEKLARDTEQPELALEPGAFRPCAHARRRGCQVRARLAAGGNRIRTIGPASGKVVDAKFHRSDPGRSNTDFGRQVLGLPWAETSNSRSRRKTTVLRLIDLCANRSDRRQSREGDRWFESTSLQRGVRNEQCAAGTGRSIASQPLGIRWPDHATDRSRYDLIPGRNGRSEAVLEAPS